MRYLRFERLAIICGVVFLAFPAVAFAQNGETDDPLEERDPASQATDGVGREDAMASLSPESVNDQEQSRDQEEPHPLPVGDADEGLNASESKLPAEGGWSLSGEPGKGITLSASDTFAMNIRSRIQLRYQLSVSEDAAGEKQIAQLVNIGTARLWFSGTAYTPKLSYMLQLAVAGRDYREGATSPIYDAYVQYEAHRDIALRMGQFFVPFDRLRTVREWALQMAERPRPVWELTLDRDVGLLIYSQRFLGDDSPFAWHLGVFGGGGTNLTAAREPGALLTARLELRPLGPIDDEQEGDPGRRAKPGLAFGAGLAKNYNTNRLRSTTGPTFQTGTTDYLHAALDMIFKWRGLYLQAEALWKEASRDQLRGMNPAGELMTEYTRSGYGWVLQGSYAFDPPFELVGRVARLYARQGTDPSMVRDVESRGQEVAAGVNYYLNGHRLKVQTDLIAYLPSGYDFGRASYTAFGLLDATF